VAKIMTKHNPECHLASHNQHLCYIVSQGFDISDPEEYASLVSKPHHFECAHCGRLANRDQNICKPVKL